MHPARRQVFAASKETTRAVAVAVAVALAVQAQTPPPQQDTVIRSTTRLVEIHVAVWDNQGKRVTDLQKEDFQVFDEGADRSIVSFTVDGATSRSRDPLQRERSSSDGDVDGYSAILLDWLNSPADSRLRGDNAVRKVLSTLPVRQDVAIYALGTEPPNARFPLTVISDFGGSSADIVGSIVDPLSLPGAELEPSGSGGRRLSVEQQAFDWNNRIMDTVRALSYLADRMARLPGKKSVIWLTHGFPVTVDGNVVQGAKPADTRPYLKEVDRILAKFNQLNITVHAVDTHGLAVIGRSYGDTLKQVAERTGGTVFLDRNDLDTGVQIALEDMHVGYTLGFLVPDGAVAGMHRIKVRSTRQNVKLSFRESYEVSQ